MARLLQDEYSDVIEKYTVVDCRYPYEYDGGHILVRIAYTLQFLPRDAMMNSYGCVVTRYQSALQSLVFNFLPQQNVTSCLSCVFFLSSNDSK